MIILKLKNADQETKIDFPCLHEHIRYRLEEIGFRLRAFALTHLKFSLIWVRNHE